MLRRAVVIYAEMLNKLLHIIRFKFFVFRQGPIEASVIFHYSTVICGSPF